ncbi:MAG: hypothetical protein ACRDSJ_01780, partial [Rubrobacteraceae bacterium]
ADQLADLDFSSLEDELAAKRQERESSGPGFGERLRERFRRKESDDRGESRRGGDDARTRGRYELREGRWYEPHDFDPEPITFKSGALSFVGAFLAFIVVGQIGLWAMGQNPGVFAGIQVLEPFMFLLYTITGLVSAYFAFRAAGYWAVALVFIAALVVGGQGPDDFLLLQFAAVGIGLLLLVIYLGNRRDQASRR